MGAEAKCCALAALVLASCSHAPGNASEPTSENAPNTAQSATDSAPPKTGPRMTSTNPANLRCIERLSLDRETSVLNEHRRVGSGADDFARRYAAEYIDPQTYLPVSVVAHYTIGDSPILWFNPARTAIVVNAAVLSDLTVVEPMRMSPGESKEIGTLTELAVDRIGGRRLTLFLLHARVIGTYWHIGSTLCLVEERDRNGMYEARFTGNHTFFTNEKRQEPLAFSVTIENQLISVRADARTN